MSQAGLSGDPFEFGDWRVEPSRGVIARAEGGAESRLEPRLMDLLLLFAGSGGRVLPKDDIIEAVWGGRAIGDGTLAAAVSRLRRALCETAVRRYIETIPKRGYRLIEPRVAPPQLGPRGAACAPPGKAAALVAEGRAALQAPFAPGLAQARLYFEAAVREAPGWGPAHAGLADALTAQHFAGQGAGLIAAARAAAYAAVGLEPDQGSAWASLGLALLLADRSFAAADEALRRAISLEPELASGHRNRAFAFAAIGRFVEAEREARRAVELEPVSIATRGLLLQLLITGRRYGQAIVAAHETIAIAPTASEGWYAKGWAHVFGGQEEAGVQALLKGLELWGLSGDQLAGLRRTYDIEGFPSLCAAGADLFEGQSLIFTPKLTDIAFLRAAAGQLDQAFTALDGAAAKDDPLLVLLPWLPCLDPLHDDPRWRRLLDRVRLVR